MNKLIIKEVFILICVVIDKNSNDLSMVTLGFTQLAHDNEVMTHFSDI
jgi:hypothetical protein